MWDRGERWKVSALKYVVKNFLSFKCDISVGIAAEIQIQWK